MSYVWLLDMVVGFDTDVKNHSGIRDIVVGHFKGT